MKTKYVVERDPQLVASSDSDLKLRSFTSVLQNELHNVLHTGSQFAQAAAVGRLYSRAPKKMEFEDTTVLDLKARDSFFLLNFSLPARTVRLSSSIVSDARDFITHALERYTSLVNPDLVQSTLDLDHLVGLWRFGPGSAVGTDASHFAEKICVNRPSVTPACARLAQLVRYHDPRLRVIDAKEHNVTVDSNPEEYMSLVQGSSLFTVPKSETTMRTAFTEPLMNMSTQLACGAYVQGALRAVGLDITTQQDKNKDLAREGSISGRLATLDLKSASDLIQPALIAELWPSVWFDLLSTCRSEYGRIYENGDYVKLNMMSTMGNGFTFPVMTLTLLALVYATQSKRLKRRFFVDYADTAVYGDDIIVPIEDYDELCEVLRHAGLVVNLDKSYASGVFRESCGGDFAMGYDITPFYVKSLTDDLAVYVAINQVLDWSVKTGVWLTDTIIHLGSLLHKSGVPFLVPEWESPDSGVLSPLVKPRYKRLDRVRNTKLKNPKREIYEALLLMITGGYVESFGHLIKYTARGEPPRGKKDDDTEVVLYEVTSVRRPKGYLTGTDSSIWSGSQVEDRRDLLFAVGFVS